MNHDSNHNEKIESVCEIARLKRKANLWDGLLTVLSSLVGFALSLAVMVGVMSGDLLWYVLSMSLLLGYLISLKPREEDTNTTVQVKTGEKGMNQGDS